MEALELLPGLYALPVGALVYKDYAVVADLHLGFEEEMGRKGVFLPPAQLKRALSVLGSVSKVARKLVVAGDLKHQFGRLGRAERRDVEEFLTAVEAKGMELVLVRGNHDNFVRKIVEDRGFDVVEVLDLDGGIRVIHGHKEAELGEVTLMGHEHPSIAVRDPVGAVAKFPCFLRVPAGGRELVVLPAVGLYQSGTNVTPSGEAYLSPILRGLDLRRAVPYVADPELGVVEFPALEEMAPVLVEEPGR
ncbi:MAG: metallophosphoesterase [Crenarchaeota archaeon]|nr:metallophosphoesterase [Thermoproteota archaeon]